MTKKKQPSEIKKVSEEPNLVTETDTNINNKLVCENESLNGKVIIKPFKTEIDIVDRDNVSEGNFYKYYHPIIAPLNGTGRKGFNYNDYNNNIHPAYAGVKLLEKDNKDLYPKYAKIEGIPKPSNYSF